MTTERDFDRIARAWLELMPDEAPDRAIDAVLHAVDTTPQVRSWRRLTWRSPLMNRLPMALGTAAVVVVAGMLFLSRSSPQSTTGSSPSPGSTISASASPAASTGSPPVAGGIVPSELQARWMGDHRGLVAADAGTTIVFDARTFALTQSNAETARLLSSSASSVGDGQLRLESTATIDGCTKGDIGVYRWTHSPSGRTLTMTVDVDACPTRASALAGTWWLMGCTVADDFCLGPLDAGTYKSQYIAPHLDPGAGWSPNFGALTYTVPDGWANSDDWPNTFGLVPSADSAAPGTDPAHSIGLVTQPVARSQSTPCTSEPATGVARTVDGLMTWLGQVPGVITTAPTSIRIDGHPGRSLDIRIDPAGKRCKGETTPSFSYLGPDIGLLGGERHRLILLDLGDGDVLAIVIRTTDPAAFDAFVVEAMPIVESLRFE